MESLQGYASTLRQDDHLLIETMAKLMILVSGVVCFLLVVVVNAPYGRYSSSFWGFGIPSKAAWFIQELPAFMVPMYLLCCSSGKYSGNICNLIVLGMFMAHYFNRTFIYPFKIKGGAPTPFIPFALAFIFCVYNGYMIGYYLLNLVDYPCDLLVDVKFVLGFSMFCLGMGVNIQSDSILRNLRKPGETGYKIPKGGMFEYVSGANFLGEMIEWCGFAIASWSLPGLAFAVFTCCNVGPRAYSHHQWYLKKFEDYPKERKALIPFVL